jgi:colicin import membrane protein
MEAERARLRQEAERLAAEETARLEAELERERQQRLAEEAERLAQDEERRLAEEESLERYRLEQLALEQAAVGERRAQEAQRAREEDPGSQRFSAQIAREADRYVPVIRDRVRQVWVRPPAADRDLVTVVSVRLIPGGDVVPNSVRVVRSSGHPAFDQSVVAAVYNASPLPVPSGPTFERFREFDFTFSP